MKTVPAFLVILLAQGPLVAHAQPSGGPYGPIPQTYALPDKAAHVYYVAPDGRRRGRRDDARRAHDARGGDRAGRDAATRS